MKAAVDGVIDFSKADIHNPKWYARLKLFLGEMARKEALAVKQAQYDRLARFLACVSPSSSQYNKLVEDELELFSELMHEQYGQPGQTKTDFVKKLMAAWNNEFGDSSSPEVQKKIDAVAAGLRQETQKSKRRRK